jgi:hypothetical protein
VEISDFSRVSFGSLWAPGLEHEPSPEERQLGIQACGKDFVGDNLSFDLSRFLMLDGRSILGALS